jgi:hypothetical protein
MQVGLRLGVYTFPENNKEPLRGLPRRDEAPWHADVLPFFVPKRKSHAPILSSGSDRVF